MPSMWLSDSQSMRLPFPNLCRLDALQRDSRRLVMMANGMLYDRRNRSGLLLRRYDDLPLPPSILRGHHGTQDIDRENRWLLPDRRSASLLRPSHVSRRETTPRPPPPPRPREPRLTFEPTRLAMGNVCDPSSTTTSAIAIL